MTKHPVPKTEPYENEGLGMRDQNESREIQRTGTSPSSGESKQLSYILVNCASALQSHWLNWQEDLFAEILKLSQQVTWRILEGKSQNTLTAGQEHKRQGQSTCTCMDSHHRWVCSYSSRKVGKRNQHNHDAHGERTALKFRRESHAKMIQVLQ